MKIIFKIIVFRVKFYKEPLKSEVSVILKLTKNKYRHPIIFLRKRSARNLRYFQQRAPVLWGRNASPAHTAPTRQQAKSR